MGELIGLVAVIGIFGTPLIAVISYHQRKLAEMNSRGGGDASGSVARELASLRQEVADLRDTATKYDLSFDTALQRMEQRMGSVEQRLTAVEQDSGQRRVTVGQGG